MARLELYGTKRCPYTEEMREWLQWLGRDFIEYDVDSDPGARSRMREVSSGCRNVPLLVEDGKVLQEGWQGRSCVVDVE
jgi:glutaredoxin 3